MNSVYTQLPLQIMDLKKKTIRSKKFFVGEDPEFLDLIASSPKSREARKAIREAKPLRTFKPRAPKPPEIKDADYIPNLPKKRLQEYPAGTKKPIRDFSSSLDEFDDEHSPKTLAPIPNTKILEIRPGNVQSVAYQSPDQPLQLEDNSDHDSATDDISDISDTSISPSRALMGSEETALSKRMRKRLYSMFGQRSDVIIDMLEMTDTDPAAALLTRTLLQTMVDVLPTIEKSVRTSKGQRGIMPLNQTISQIRELITDLQAFKDKSNLGRSIVERNIRPAYMDIAVQVSMIFVETENYARARMTKEDFDKFQDNNLNMKKSFSDFVMKQYQEIAQVVSKTI